ncbi:hypothetical protein D187_006053 [Cystobacter fuscus DSM 2262]|uniref:Uncharacterized protein n=1 Tax=Cystobacter fuscus (strain ATCC 25194 / DSM 2262 / NBRC 100088 / M29) TaxID=1242864 RepID=S9PH45_CYSF2|nr:hypothetical protein [Cystobacter fuscus]EPX63645.1 hypothetical protein D187_006053 [Cystobacter fuscus DSM 2262]
MTKKKSAGYSEKIKHVQATHPEPWPGIQGRSAEREEDLPTGTKRAEQADVTDAQRQLEQDMDESAASTRE